MSFGNIIGQMLQQGLGGQEQTRQRVATGAQNLSAGGSGVEQILGQLQSALGGRGGATGGGAMPSGLQGLAEAAKAFLGQPQVGGMSGGQLGGIGALAGAVLGGGGKGAVRGGMLALLGTMAVKALQQSRAQQGGAAAGDLALSPSEAQALTSPENERLLLRAMIAAAKADGHIDQQEMQGIIGKLAADDVTEEEKAFVMAEIRAPLDPNALAAEVRSPAQAAEVYAASILAVDIDSDAERQYLRSLAQALRLDAATVAELHRMTGAPAV
jgi:uncharacterized membrane protein YebE (DUF533 family)